MNLYQNVKRLPFTIQEKKKAAARERVIKWWAHHVEEVVEFINSGNMPSLSKMSTDQRLMHYTQMTDANDFPLLEDPDYFEKYQAGMYPILISPRWQSLMSIPAQFKAVQKDFMSLYKQKVVNA